LERFDEKIVDLLASPILLQQQFAQELQENSEWEEQVIGDDCQM
jgi:hypothetical protein